MLLNSGQFTEGFCLFLQLLQVFLGEIDKGEAESGKWFDGESRDDFLRCWAETRVIFQFEAVINPFSGDDRDAQFTGQLFV